MAELPYHVDSYYPPRAGVADRRRAAELSAKRLVAQGWRLQPVTAAAAHFATTRWGKAWCDNLDAWQEHASRMAHGLGYLRNGAVINLRIEGGKVTAMVQGSKLYNVRIDVKPLSPAKWAKLREAFANDPDGLGLGAALVPTPRELQTNCECPDWSGYCKHVAAALYGVAVRLDAQPELLLALRGVAPAEP